MSLGSADAFDQYKIPVTITIVLNHTTHSVMSV